ncbi:MAG: DUF3168 domain-containing protein [Cognatishimia activa]
MEEEFRALLVGSAAVAAICGDRINFGENPQGEGLPAIVLNVISAAEGETLGGTDNLSQGRVQVDCYGHDYGTAKRLARAAKNTLSAYRGGGFQGIFHEDSRDNREGGSNEAERPFRVSMDFLTNWSEDND